MPRHAKGPRLYLRKGRIDRRTGEELPARYFIRDGAREVGTGCGPDRLPDAERQLADYIGAKWTPEARPEAELSDPYAVLVADVLALYAKERAPKLAADPKSTAGFIKHLLNWWDDRTLSDVKRSTCEAYVKHRTAMTNSRAKGGDDRPEPKRISDQTARRELETLSAAIGYWDGEHHLSLRPKVSLPDQVAENPRDALTRSQAAALLKAAMGYRKRQDGTWTRLGPSQRANRAHLRRFIVIGFYTGSRPDVTRRLLWETSATNPWVALDAAVIYRRGRKVREQRTKRTPPLKIPKRLMAHLRRWRRLDRRREAELRKDNPMAVLNAVIHHGGEPLAGKVRTGFEGCVRDAGLPQNITPHWLRHTAATWLMEANVDIWAASGFLGMSPEMIERVYGHHRPDYQAEVARSLNSPHSPVIPQKRSKSA